MTPSALTPAARGSTKKTRPDASSRPSQGRGSGHRSTVRRSKTPAAPRRVSGPSAPSAATTTAAAASGVIAVPAPTRTRPSRPARPARPARQTRPRRARSVTKAPWGPRTAAYVRGLPDHVLLDRIIRGRVWIPLLGVLLAGIVAMQVEVLKLNAGIGRSLEQSSVLQGQNELLHASVARLSDEQRIERLAAQMGMVMPAPTQLHFVQGGPTSVERALGSIHAPDGANFIAHLPTIGAPAAPQGTSVNTAPGLTPGSTATGTSSAAGTTGTVGATGTSGTVGTTGTSSTTGSSGTTGTSGTSSSTGTSGTSSTGTTGVTGTSGSTDTSGSTGTSGTSTVTPAGATTSAGTTDQSGSSSTGGAAPVGG